MRCDRCNTETRESICSWYNEQIICTSCAEKEKLRADYRACREAELEAVKRGDFNFTFKSAWKEG